MSARPRYGRPSGVRGTVPVSLDEGYCCYRPSLVIWPYATSINSMLCMAETYQTAIDSDLMSA